MNEAELITKRSQAKNLLDWRVGQNGQKNTVRIGDNESRAHALKKCEICHMLKGLEKEYYTEAIFKGGGQADIFVLDDCVAIEILNSEKQKSIDSKSRKYPCRIIAVPVNEEFKEEMLY